MINIVIMMQLTFRCHTTYVRPLVISLFQYDMCRPHLCYGCAGGMPGICLFGHWFPPRVPRPQLLAQVRGLLCDAEDAYIVQLWYGN